MADNSNTEVQGQLRFGSPAPRDRHLKMLERHANRIADLTVLDYKHRVKMALTTLDYHRLTEADRLLVDGLARSITATKILRPLHTDVGPVSQALASKIQALSSALAPSPVISNPAPPLTFNNTLASTSAPVPASELASEPPIASSLDIKAEPTLPDNVPAIPTAPALVTSSTTRKPKGKARSESSKKYETPVPRFLPGRRRTQVKQIDGPSHSGPVRNTRSAAVKHGEEANAEVSTQVIPTAADPFIVPAIPCAPALVIAEAAATTSSSTARKAKGKARTGSSKKYETSVPKSLPGKRRTQVKQLIDGTARSGPVRNTRSAALERDVEGNAELSTQVIPTAADPLVVPAIPCSPAIVMTEAADTTSSSTTRQANGKARSESSKKYETSVPRSLPRKRSTQANQVAGTARNTRSAARERDAKANAELSTQVMLTPADPLVNSPSPSHGQTSMQLDVEFTDKSADDIFPLSDYISPDIRRFSDDANLVPTPSDPSTSPGPVEIPGHSMTPELKVVEREISTLAHPVLPTYSSDRT